MADKSDFESACSNALKSFGFEKSKDIQRRNKSKAKMFWFSKQRRLFSTMEGSSGSIVLVILPLVSLVRDQDNFLTSKDIKTALIGQEEDGESVIC